MKNQEMVIKWKLEKKNGNKKCTNYWCSVFLRESLVVCFFITLVFYLTTFRWLALTHALCLILYWACHYLFCVIDLVTNNESGSHVRESRHKTDHESNSLGFEKGRHSSSHNLVPTPSLTFSFDCLQYAKQMMAAYTQALFYLVQ